MGTKTPKQHGQKRTALDVLAQFWWIVGGLGLAALLISVYVFYKGGVIELAISPTGGMRMVWGQAPRQAEQPAEERTKKEKFIQPSPHKDYAPIIPFNKDAQKDVAPDAGQNTKPLKPAERPKRMALPEKPKKIELGTYWERMRVQGDLDGSEEDASEDESILVEKPCTPDDMPIQCHMPQSQRKASPVVREW